MSTYHRALAALIVVTLFWGLTFPLIRTSVQYISPLNFVFLRFLCASIVLFPFVIHKLKYTTPRLLKQSALLGGFIFFSYTSQSIGLKYIPANESAFITASAVIFVPCLMQIFRTGTPTIIDYGSSLFCLLGLYVLTGAGISHLSLGEWLTLGTAFCFAVYILLMDHISRQKPDYALLAFYQIFFITLMAMPFFHSPSLAMLQRFDVLSAILFCAIFATVFVFYFQTTYQQYVAATKVALIYCIEPVFASIFAYFLNNEPITWRLIMGGFIILVSIVMPDLWRILKRQKTQEIPAPSVVN